MRHFVIENSKSFVQICIIYVTFHEWFENSTRNYSYRTQFIHLYGVQPLGHQNQYPSLTKHRKLPSSYISTLKMTRIKSDRDQDAYKNLPKTRNVPKADHEFLLCSMHVRQTIFHDGQDIIISVMCFNILPHPQHEIDNYS